MANEEFENYEERLSEKSLYPKEENKKEPKEFDGIIRGMIPKDRIKNIEKVQRETEQIDSLLRDRNYPGLEKTTAEINGRDYPCWTFQINNQPASIVLFQDRWTLEISSGSFEDLKNWSYQGVDGLFNLIDNHIDKKEDRELVLSQEDFNRIKNFTVFDKEIERIGNLEPDVGLEMKKEADIFLDKTSDIDHFKWIFEDYLKEFNGKYRDPYEEYMKAQEEAQKVSIDQIKVEGEVLDRVMFKTEEAQHMILTEPNSYSDERKALAYTSKEDEIIKEEKSVNQILEEIKDKPLERLNEEELQEMDWIIEQEVNPNIDRTKQVTEREKNFEKWLELKESYHFHQYNVGTEEYEIPSYTFKLGNELMCIVEGKNGSLLYRAENGSFDNLRMDYYEDNDKMFKDIEEFQAKGNNPKIITDYPKQMSNYVMIESGLQLVYNEDRELWAELRAEASERLDGNEEHEKGFIDKLNNSLIQIKETIQEKAGQAWKWCKDHKTQILGTASVVLLLSPTPTIGANDNQICRFDPTKPTIQEDAPKTPLQDTQDNYEYQVYGEKTNMFGIHEEKNQHVGQVKNKEADPGIEKESHETITKEEDKVIIENLPGTENNIIIDYDNSTAEKNPDGTINKDDGNIKDIIIQDTEKPNKPIVTPEPEKGPEQEIQPEVTPQPEITPDPEITPQPEVTPELEKEPVTGPSLETDHRVETGFDKNDLGSLLGETVNQEIEKTEEAQEEIKSLEQTQEQDIWEVQDVEQER